MNSGKLKEISFALDSLISMTFSLNVVCEVTNLFESLIDMAIRLWNEIISPYQQPQQQQNIKDENNVNNNHESSTPATIDFELFSSFKPQEKQKFALELFRKLCIVLRNFSFESDNEPLFLLNMDAIATFVSEWKEARLPVDVLHDLLRVLANVGQSLSLDSTSIEDPQGFVKSIVVSLLSSLNSCDGGLSVALACLVSLAQKQSNLPRLLDSGSDDLLKGLEMALYLSTNSQQLESVLEFFRLTLRNGSLQFRLKIAQHPGIMHSFLNILVEFKRHQQYRITTNVNETIAKSALNCLYYIGVEPLSYDHLIAYQIQFVELLVQFSNDEHFKQQLGEIVGLLYSNL